MSEPGWVLGPSYSFSKASMLVPMRALRAALALLLAASTAAAGPVAPVTVAVPRLTPSGSAAAGVVPQVRLSGALSAPGLALGAPSLSPSLTLSAAPAALAPSALPAALPALPASLLVAPSAGPAHGSARGAPAALAAPAAPKPLVFHSLQDFARHVLEGRGELAADRVYSGAASARGLAPEVDAKGERPAIPAGVREVEVHSVRGPRDVDAWIPAGSNSDHLRSALRASLHRMLPFDIRVYRDGVGGSFAALDLSVNPANVDRHPEIQRHEADVIRKIQLYTKDLQVLVRETGKTPDLVVSGVVTELKSFSSPGDMAKTFAQANEQVLRHAQRHGLGYGAVVVDMLGKKAVPTEDVLSDLNRFAGAARDVGFSRAYVFAGTDLKAFSRGEDGRFSVDGSARPFAPAARSRPRHAQAREVHQVQLLAKQGRLEGARSRIARLEAHAEEDPRVQEAREQLEAERVARKIGKFVSHGREKEAYALWDRFRAQHRPAVVQQVEARVREALKITLIPDAVASAQVPDPGVVLREITEPARRLREHGVRATITAYGSARIKEPAVAARLLAQAQAAADSAPGDEAAAKALLLARRDAEMSRYYELARRFGALVAEKGGGLVAVVTGGGPGIMEAANRGAFEAGGPSVGYNIILEHEQSANAYLTKGLDFEFQNFATRKIALRHGSMALTYFPGGFGTMDELFEVLTLMQTGKMPRVPIVLMGEQDYWEKILDFDEFARMGLISPGDLSLFTFAEDEHQAWAAIEKGIASPR